MTSFNKRDSLDLVSMLSASHVQGFEFVPQRDEVLKIKFIGGDRPSHLRVYMVIGGVNMVANAKLDHSHADLQHFESYSDEPIFNVDQKTLSP